MEPPTIIAVDCPSGVDCDQGGASPEAIKADTTVCIGAIKSGLLKFPAFSFVGELAQLDIGFAGRSATYDAIHRYVADPEMILGYLPARPADAHKGTFGTALIVAGSVNYTGAVVMAGAACYRIGAGLVTLGVPTPIHTALAGQIIEATWLLLPNEIGVIAADAAPVVQKAIHNTDALLLGPGWGTEATTRDFLSKLISNETPREHGRMGFAAPASDHNHLEKTDLPPTVIDADGLKLLSQIPNWTKTHPKDTILTPHPGEMSILCGLPIQEIQADRVDQAEKYASEWGVVLVLKGAFTVIAEPHGRSVTIPIATSALAKAGTGDVLAGMITGLIAQKVSPFEAAVAAAWIHGQAGLWAAETIGNDASVMASDVIDSIADVLSQLRGEAL